MSPVTQLASVVGEALGGPRPEPDRSVVRTDTVYVVHPPGELMARALRVAAEFANALGVPVTIIDFKSVPDIPKQEDPAIAQLRAQGLEVRCRGYVSSDPRRAIPLAFRPHSLVVVAGRRSWWPTWGERWRRALETAGHFVVFVDKERFHA